MKNIMGLLIALSMTIFTVCNTFANTPTYENSMEIALEKMEIEQPNWSEIATDFEVIMNKNESEWLPLYYYALAKTKGMEEVKKAEKDALLDAAEIALEKAIALQPTESELFALQANIYMMRIAIKPLRGRSHSGLAYGALKKAKALNENNPRVYVLYGLMIYNTPKQFGGGEMAAAKWFYAAKEKFETFEAVSDLHPTWGEAVNDEMLKNY
jgi:hypothetical protein